MTAVLQGANTVFSRGPCAAPACVALSRPASAAPVSSLATAAPVQQHRRSVRAGREGGRGPGLETQPRLRYSPPELRHGNSGTATRHSDRLSGAAKKRGFGAVLQERRRPPCISSALAFPSALCCHRRAGTPMALSRRAGARARAVRPRRGGPSQKESSGTKMARTVLPSNWRLCSDSLALALAASDS